MIRWEKVRGPEAVGAVVIATALGAGLFPFAPGTMGTLAAMPVAYLTALYGWGWPERVGLWLMLLALGVWAAKTLDQKMGTKDSPCIVIDEVVGLGIASWTAGTRVETLIAAFILFRIFDIVKPPPVRQADRWSKSRSSKNAHWKSGFGVMIDDVLAGFMTLAVIMVLQHNRILP